MKYKYTHSDTLTQISYLDCCNHGQQPLKLNGLACSCLPLGGSAEIRGFEHVTLYKLVVPSDLMPAKVAFFHLSISSWSRFSRRYARSGSSILSDRGAHCTITSQVAVEGSRTLHRALQLHQRTGPSYVTGQLSVVDCLASAGA